MNAHQQIVDALMSQQGRGLRALGQPAVQRNRSDEDCAFAATANTLGVPYEKAAAAFGFPVQHDGGAPSAPKGRGFHIGEIGPAMSRLGVPTVTAITSKHPQNLMPEAIRMSADRLRRELEGQTAVVMIIDSDNEGHCLALRDGVMVDPRAPDPYSKTLATITNIVGAVVVAGRENSVGEAAHVQP